MAWLWVLRLCVRFLSEIVKREREIYIYIKCEKSAKMVRCKGETWTKARIKFLAQNWLGSSRSEPDICKHFEF